MIEKISSAVMNGPDNLTPMMVALPGVGFEDDATLIAWIMQWVSLLMLSEACFVSKTSSLIAA
jgi:hypothetical protein